MSAVNIPPAPPGFDEDVTLSRAPSIPAPPPGFDEDVPLNRAIPPAPPGFDEDVPLGTERAAVAPPPAAPVPSTPQPPIESSALDVFSGATTGAPASVPVAPAPPPGQAMKPSDIKANMSMPTTGADVMMSNLPPSMKGERVDFNKPARDSRAMLDEAMKNAPDVPTDQIDSLPAQQRALAKMRNAIALNTIQPGDTTKMTPEERDGLVKRFGKQLANDLILRDIEGVRELDPNRLRHLVDPTGISSSIPLRMPPMPTEANRKALNTVTTHDQLLRVQAAEQAMDEIKLRHPDAAGASIDLDGTMVRIKGDISDEAKADWNKTYEGVVGKLGVTPLPEGSPYVSTVVPDWAQTLGHSLGIGRNEFTESKGTRKPLPGEPGYAEADPNSVSFNVPPAETTGEKVTDVASGLGAIMVRLAIAKKLVPGSLPEKARSILAWELENRASGGTPLEGAATGAVFEGVGSLPGKTLGQRALKTGVESAALGAMTAAHGGNEEDILVSMLIPPTMHVVMGGAARIFRDRLGKAKTPQDIADIAREAQVLREQHGSIVSFVENADRDTLNRVRARYAKNAKTDAKARAMVDAIDAKLSGKPLRDEPARGQEKPVRGAIGDGTEPQAPTSPAQPRQQGPTQTPTEAARTQQATTTPAPQAETEFTKTPPVTEGAGQGMEDSGTSGVRGPESPVAGHDVVALKEVGGKLVPVIRETTTETPNAQGTQAETEAAPTGETRAEEPAAPVRQADNPPQLPDQGQQPGGREPVAEPPPTEQSPPDGYFKGDAYRLTGNEKGGFLEAELLEGHRKGETVSVPRKEDTAARAEQMKAQRGRQQEGFRRLRESQQSPAPGQGSPEAGTTQTDSDRFNAPPPSVIAIPNDLAAMPDADLQRAIKTDKFISDETRDAVRAEYERRQQDIDADAASDADLERAKSMTPDEWESLSESDADEFERMAMIADANGVSEPLEVDPDTFIINKGEADEPSPDTTQSPDEPGLGAPSSEAGSGKSVSTPRPRTPSATATEAAQLSLIGGDEAAPGELFTPDQKAGAVRRAPLPAPPKTQGKSGADLIDDAFRESQTPKDAETGEMFGDEPTKPTGSGESKTGALKVGDRIRHRGELGTVTRVVKDGGSVGLKMDDGTKGRLAKISEVERLNDTELQSGLSLKLVDWLRNIKDAFLSNKGEPLSIPDELKSVSKEVEQRLAAAEGIKKEALVVRAKNAGILFINHFRRHFPHIDYKKDAVHAMATDLLRQFEGAGEWAKFQAIDTIARITQGLDKNSTRLLSRMLVLPDIKKDIEAGLYADKELPFGYKDLAEINTDLDRYQKLVDENPHVADALDRRKKFARDITQRLVDHELLPSEVLDDDRYYHRQVMAYMDAKDTAYPGTGTVDVRTHKKGFQRTRTGGGDFNVRYQESEFEWMSQALSQIAAKEALDRVQAVADIKPALSRDAKQQNLVTIYGGIENLQKSYELREQIAESWNGEDRNESDERARRKALIEQLEKIDPLYPFRIQLAKAMSKLSDMAADGLLHHVPAKYQHVVNDLAARNDKSGEDNYAIEDVTSKDLFGMLSWLVYQGEGKAGSGQAASVFKAIRERETFIKETAGDRFVEWNDLIPEGYKEWQPVKGNLMFLGQTIEERVLDRWQREGIAKLPEEIREHARQSLIVGGPKPSWVLPEGIAKTMDSIKKIDENFIESLWTGLQSTWKQYVLINPIRVTKYNINNMSGDIDIAAAFDPKITLGMKRAGADLWNVMVRHQGSAAARDEINDAMRRGAIGSGLTIAEIPDINKEGAFRALIDSTKGGKLTQAAVTAWGGLKTLTNWRENILRLAAYRHFQEQLKQGKKTYGVSSKKQIDLMRQAGAADKDIAAKLARELIGDYGNVSAGGTWIRRHMMPFYSWMEVNAPRYARLLRNLPYEEAGMAGSAGRRAARIGGFAAKRGAGRAASYAIKAGVALILFNSMYILTKLWNQAMYPDEEEELRRSGRENHLILGKRDDGSIRTLRIEGAFGDALEWFGARDYPADIQDVVSGKATVEDKAHEAVKAPIERVVQSWEPFSKSMMELSTGRTTYPHLFREGSDWSTATTPIRDKEEYLARMWSLDGLYRRVTGKPSQPNKQGVLGALNPESLVFYRTEPAEAAYWEARSKATEWATKELGKSFGATDPTDRSNALYYYRKATQWNDEKAAVKWLAEYYKLGGTEKGLSQSIKGQDPLHAIPKASRWEYEQTLTEKEREELGEARKWYGRVYGVEPDQSMRQISLPALDDWNAAHPDADPLKLTNPGKTLTDNGKEIPLTPTQHAWLVTEYEKAMGKRFAAGINSAKIFESQSADKLNLLRLRLRNAIRADKSLPD